MFEYNDSPKPADTRISKTDFTKYIRRFLAYSVDVRNLSPHSIDAYARDLQQLHKWICAEQLFPVCFDYALISRYTYYQVRYRKLDARSVNRAFSAIKTFVKYLISSHDMQALRNTLPYIGSMRTQKRLPKNISVEQIDAIIPTPTNFIRARDSALIETLYSTGCRISELLAITTAQFLDSHGSIIVRGKGNKEREVYIGARAQTAIETYLSFRNTHEHAISKNRCAVAHVDANIPPTASTYSDGVTPHPTHVLDSTHHSAVCTERSAAGITYSTARAISYIDSALFVNYSGHRLTRQGANTIIKKYQYALSLKDSISAHSFRHSFATHILDSGADIRVVQELLGHAQISSTQIYTHVSVTKMQNAYRRAHPHSRRILSNIDKK